MYSYYDGSQARALLKLPWRIIKLGPLPAYRLWRRSVARRGVSGGVGYSKFMSAVHQPHLPGKVSYIPLGINLTNLPDRPALRPRTPLRFGFVAGFQLSKGIWHVLDAVKSLKQIGLEFELHIWGPGQESNQHAITSRDLDDRVRLRGMYAPDEKWQVYNEIDVAIMATTVCEPLGRVPLEAAAVGAPTIAPAIGGITETIEDGVDGLLYRFQDPKDLERQMRRVLEEPSLFQSLVAGLKPVPDTRTRAVEVEKFYFEILGQLPQQNACPSA
jgi:glycosyltransferase involved in cell wall biosynthesis